MILYSGELRHGILHLRLYDNGIVVEHDVEICYTKFVFYGYAHFS